MMQKILEFFSRLPQAVILTLAIGMLVVLGAVDVHTGYEIAFSLFYLVPILFAAWFGATWYAVSISVLSAAIWLWADLTSGHTFSHAAIPVWNSLMRLGFFLIITFSITKIRQLLEKEQSTARTDFLTGVANRRSFYETLRVETDRSGRTGRSFSVAYIDVDNFKTVNDTFGHSTGDELLVALSTTIGETIRSLDVIARLGGDEFAVLFPETDEQKARSAATKIRERLLRLVRQNELPITLSMGVIICTGCCDPDEIVRQADHLMYEVKQSGKNSIAYGTYAGKRTAY